MLGSWHLGIGLGTLGDVQSRMLARCFIFYFQCVLFGCVILFLLNNCVNNLILINKRIQTQTYFLNNKKMICILKFRLLCVDVVLPTHSWNLITFHFMLIFFSFLFFSSFLGLSAHLTGDSLVKEIKSYQNKIIWVKNLTYYQTIKLQYLYMLTQNLIFLYLFGLFQSNFQLLPI